LRKDTFNNENGTSTNSDGLVDVQQSDRHTTGAGSTNQNGAIPFEVIFPRVRSRIEQTGELPGFFVNPRNVSSFERIAIKAAVRQVLQFRWPAVLSGKNVVDVKRLVIQCVWDVTIFASAAGAIANLLFQPLVHAVHAAG
jgi:hypothetical protein